MGPLGGDPLESSDDELRSEVRSFFDLFGSEVLRVALLAELLGSEPFALGVLPAAVCLGLCQSPLFLGFLSVLFRAWNPRVSSDGKRRVRVLGFVDSVILKGK